MPEHTGEAEISDVDGGVGLSERLRDARLWAAEQLCVINIEGEVGFGRECVGVLNGHAYVDTPGSGHNDFEGHSDAYLRRVMAPEHVRAYHKHDCLCVLGRGEDALAQLLDWLDQLRGYGATVRVEERRFRGRPDLINLALHGPTRALISFPDLPGDDRTVYWWEGRDREAS